MTRARDLSNFIGSGSFSSTTFTATAGQTVFTIAHTQGFVQVFMNGLLLDLTTDYTSNGSAITLTTAAAAGDEIEVVKYNTFSVGDAVPASGGNFTGNVNIPGHVVQVKQTVVNSTFSTAIGPSFVEMTDFRTNITPASTSNKILIKASLYVGQSYWSARGRILKDTTPISGALGAAAGSRTPATWYNVTYDAGASSSSTYDVNCVSFEYLDSPSTTSQITYSLDIGGYSTGHTVFLNRSHYDWDSAAFDSRTISTLTLMEIAQ